MEPAIRYASTSDDVTIAYWAFGQGRPLIDVHPPGFSHIQLDWQGEGNFHRGLSAKRQLVRFDNRGSGLSDRHVSDVSPGRLLEDMESVVDHLGIDRFAVFTEASGALIAMDYAAKHPHRVAALILHDGFARMADFWEIPRMRSLRALLDDWELFTENLASAAFGWDARAPAREFAAYIRASTDPSVMAKYIDQNAKADVSQLLSSIHAPTLVLTEREVSFPTFDMSRILAARIPNARLRVLDSETMWSDGVQTAILNAVDDFLAESWEQPLIDVEPGRTEATMTMAAAREKSFSSGRYVVRRVLGEGGQKIVYLVHDTALDRECALSVIKRDLLEPDDLLRLQREAQSMARLGANSTVVTVFDIGEDDGTPYIVCEYVPGGDLSHELRTVGTLSLDRALAIATDVAEALVIAHAHGVVHRDIKPSNVWICENGSAKLGDFGLAFSLDRSRLTMPGTFLGTASYMPPEQALGRPAEPRSDLYSLGAILYEMVTGAPPFVADDALSVISQHVNVTPVPPSAHNPDLPPALDVLILHLLEKSPDDRPASASDVAVELRSVRQTAAHRS